MLIGIEFKRKKVFLVDENRTVWYWRVAPYIKDVDPVKIGAFFVFTLGMTVLVLLGSVYEVK